MHKPLVPDARRSSSPILGTICSIAMIGVVVSATGCTYAPIVRSTLAPYEEISCRCVVDMKARVRARSIWRQKNADCYKGRSNAHDVKRGFIEGFVDTALGGDGCPPLVAPQGCLSNKTTMAGHSWFEGFPLGVAAAESVGADRWTKTIALSPHLRECFANQGCNAGCSPCGTPSCGDSPACGCGQPSCGGGCGGCGDSPACGCGQPACGGGCGATNLSTVPEFIQTGMVDQNEARLMDHSAPPVERPIAGPEVADEQVLQAIAANGKADDDEFSTVVPIVPKATNADGPAPTITGPVEMPNLQVSFDAESEDSVFNIEPAMDVVKNTEQASTATKH